MKPILLQIMLFVYVTSPLVRIGQYGVNLVLLLSIPASVYCIGMKKKISASIWKYMLLPCFLNLLYFTALAASISFKDITFIKLICYAFGYGVITFCLCIGYQKIYSGDTYTLMLRHIVNLASINVFIMVLFILYPSAIDFFDQFLNMDQMYKLAFAPRGMVRAYGISSFGGATLSVFYAILLMLHYRSLKSVNGKALVVGVLKTALLFLGICLSGRTGFVVLLLFLISDLIRRSWLFVRLKMPKKNSSLRVALVLVAIVGLLVLTNMEERFERPLKRAFEAYYSFVEDRTLWTDSSYAIVHGHLIFPSDTDVWVFGTGNFGRSKNLIHLSTDPGITRTIWGSGIVGLFLLFVPNIGSILLARKIDRKEIKLPLVELSLMVPILCFKELFFLGIPGITQCIWMLAYTGIMTSSRVLQNKSKFV